MSGSRPSVQLDPLPHLGAGARAALAGPCQRLERTHNSTRRQLDVGVLPL